MTKEMKAYKESYRSIIKKIFRLYPTLSDIKILSAFFPDDGWVKTNTILDPDQLIWLSSLGAKMVSVEIQTTKTEIVDYNISALLKV